MDHDLVIVGESPSHTRPKGMENVHFSGQTSHILWDELRKYNVTRENCFVTNVVTKVLPKGVKPNREEIEDGLLQLKKDITREKPVLVLAVGKTAASAILGWDINMDSYSGNTLFSERLNIWVVPVLHPGAIARNPNLKSQFADGIWVAIESLKTIKKSMAKSKIKV